MVEVVEVVVEVVVVEVVIELVVELEDELVVVEVVVDVVVVVVVVVELVVVESASRHTVGSGSSPVNSSLWLSALPVKDSKTMLPLI